LPLARQPLVAARTRHHKELNVSFQAYLDKVEDLTGKTPNDFIALARQKNLTQHKDIIAWLKSDYGLGLGHARAIAYVIQHGPEFTLRQTTGPHRDASGTLNLAGKRSAAARKPAVKQKASKPSARKSSAKKPAPHKPAAARSSKKTQS
jgi:hypothetical protein